MSRKPRSAKKPLNLSGLGLLDIDSLNFEDGGGDDEDIDDADLEDELNALMKGKAPKKREEPKQKKAPMDLHSITAMANAAIKDDISDHESDIEGVENDEDLLAELNELEGGSAEPEPVPTRPSNVPIEPAGSSKNSPSPLDQVDILEDRLKNYRDAETAAKAIGDNSKARRFSRAIQTLAGQLKHARLGKAIPEVDIPPPVVIPKPKPVVVEPETVENVAPEDDKAPAVPSKRPGTFPPPEIAELLGNLEEDFDPSHDTESVNQEPPARAAPVLPPRSIPQDPTPQPKQTPARPAPLPPVEPKDRRGMLIFRRDQYKQAALQAKNERNTQLALKYVRTAKQFDTVINALDQGNPIDLSGMPPPPPGFQAPSIPPAPEPQSEVPSYIDLNQKEDPAFYKAPPPAETIVDALEQRLAKYKETEAQAIAEGNSSKARRFGRIVSDYKAAIKAHKAGKKVDFSELPAPPGFGPIPVPQQKEEKKPPQPASVPQTQKPSQPISNPVTKPTQVPTPPKQPNVRRQVSMTMQKQKQFLLERQKLFKDAAKQALNNGDKEQALEYLRMSKGIDPMLEATENGLPVDISSVPTPPQLQQDFVVLNAEECGFELSGDSEELYRTLERDLNKQYEICTANKENFFKLGDVASGTKFEKLGQDTQRDLNVLKAYWKRGDTIPRFHYEDRLFTIIRHNHDVAENQIQVTVVRGISLPGKPNELDTYVKIDFAFPSDAPQSYRGHTIRDTTNPEYKTTCSFEVNRKSRSFLRAVKRIQIKVEVWSKRGFLRADGLLGTANIKLADLESKCTIHDVFPLVEGRKNTGAKLEVKIRITEPFTTKQIEEIKERWLVIGS